MSGAVSRSVRRRRSPVRAPRLGLALGGALALSTLDGRADVGALLDVPLPPGAESRLVAAELVQNGRRLSIATLEPRGTLEDAFAFYRRAWPADDAHPGHLESRAGRWSVISRLDGERHVAVQLRESVDGTSGFISAMSVAERTEASLAPPMPPGASLLSSTTVRDGDTDASTFVLESRSRPAELLGFYRDRLTRAGWRVRLERDRTNASVALFERERARFEVVVTRASGGTSVAVLNEVRDGR